jgi:hypothetical protein
MVASHAPLANATGVPTSTGVTIIFRWPVAAATVKPRFSLTPFGGSAASGTFTWSMKSQKMVFKPASPLKPSKVYAVLFEAGIKRADGTTIGWQEGFHFKTGGTSPSALAVTVAAVGTNSGATQITVNLTTAASVQVTVTNAAGRTVAVLPAQDLRQGMNTLFWDGRSGHQTAVPAGRYLVRATAVNSAGNQAQAVTALELRR